MNTAKFLICVGIVLFVQGHAAAQEPDAGKIEFLSSCGACHGSDAKGKGPIADQLKVTPADLTQLAKKNGGVFPSNAVYEKIDGRQEVQAHGRRDMPVWGFRYMHSPKLWSDFAFNPIGSHIDPSEDPETLRSESVSFPSSIICTEYRKKIERPICCGALVAIGTKRTSLWPHLSAHIDPGLAASRQALE